MNNLDSLLALFTDNKKSLFFGFEVRLWLSFVGHTGADEQCACEHAVDEEIVINVSYRQRHV